MISVLYHYLVTQSCMSHIRRVAKKSMTQEYIILIRLLLYIVTDFTCLQGHYATFSRIMRFRPHTTRPLCIMGVSRNVAPKNDVILRKTSITFAQQNGDVLLTLLVKITFLSIKHKFYCCKLYKYTRNKNMNFLSK